MKNCSRKIGLTLLLLVIFTISLPNYTQAKNSIFLESATLGGEYLKNNIKDNGRFVYERNPLLNDQSLFYNILRHAGTAYSMLEIYGETKNEELLEKAEDALSYLSNQTVPCPLDIDALCIKEGDEIKLGGNALAILAFVEYERVTDDDKYRDLAQSLARYMSETQSENGEFLVHKIEGNHIDDHISDYYPGEALFALARLYEIDKNREWIETAHKGARWLIEVRDKGKTADELLHDHWLLYALNELHNDNSSELYINHTKKLVDGITREQIRFNNLGQISEDAGGYSQNPRSTPTATRSEGLVAAYRLLKRSNEQIYALRALEGALWGSLLQLRTQIDEDEAKLLNLPKDSIGGFKKRIYDYDIRIDFVQHNISSLLGIHKILSEI